MEKISKVWGAPYMLIIRAILWASATFIVPIILISSKFKLFETVDSEYKFTGWGYLAIFILAIGVYYLCKWIVKSFGYSYPLQLLDGFISLILWLILAYIVCTKISSNIDRVRFVLKWSIVSCSAGVLLNPLPYLAFKFRMRKEGRELKEALK